MRPALILCLGVLGCGGQVAVPPTLIVATPFIALGSDFDGFQSWKSYDLGELPANGLHLAGHRVIYLNHAPPTGSTTFPRGTILVKTIVDPATGATQVFAMAKRGPDFNLTGAVGWEWFELASPDGPPVLLWRGASSPTTGAYAASNTTCNTCHISGANDAVQTPQLKLESF